MIRPCFSIPVHDRFDCVEDQIKNYKHYNPNAICLLHLDFKFVGVGAPEIRVLQNRYNDDNFVILSNPKRHHCYVGLGLVKAHLSNYKYLTSTAEEFSHFCIDASNSMFILEDFHKHLASWDGGCCLGPPRNGRHFDRFKGDGPLQRYFTRIGLTPDYVVAGQCEGMFYSKEIADEMIDLLDTTMFDYNILNTPNYPQIEIVISTLINFILKRDTRYIIHPYVHSDLITIEKIKALRSMPTLSKFAVKRVPRHINDPLRVYIRENL